MSKRRLWAHDLRRLSPDVAEKIVIEGQQDEKGNWTWAAFVGTWREFDTAWTKSYDDPGEAVTAAADLLVNRPQDLGRP